MEVHGRPNPTPAVSKTEPIQPQPPTQAEYDAVNELYGVFYSAPYPTSDTPSLANTPTQLYMLFQAVNNFMALFPPGGPEQGDPCSDIYGMLNEPISGVLNSPTLYQLSQWPLTTSIATIEQNLSSIQSFFSFLNYQGTSVASILDAFYQSVGTGGTPVSSQVTDAFSNLAEDIGTARASLPPDWSQVIADIHTIHTMSQQTGMQTGWNALLCQLITAPLDGGCSVSLYSLAQESGDSQNKDFMFWTTPYPYQSPPGMPFPKGSQAVDPAHFIQNNLLPLFSGSSINHKPS